MHYNLLHAYINVYRANSDNGDETNVYSDQVNGRHHRICLNRLNNNMPTSIKYNDKSVPNNNNNNHFALRNHNKIRNNIFQVRCNNTIIAMFPRV